MEPILPGDLVKVGAEVREELLEEPAGLGLLPLCLALRVDVRKEEGPEAHHGAPHLRGHAHLARGLCALDHVPDHAFDALRGGVAKDLAGIGGEVLLAKEPGALGVVDVMRHVGHAVRQADDAPLRRHGAKAS